MDVERRKRPAPADAGRSRPTAGTGATTPSRRVRRWDVGPVPGSLPDAALGHRTGPETPPQTRIRRRTDAGAPMPEQVQILTPVRPTLKLRIIQGDGRIDDVGNGAATVWLVRTSPSVDHYLAARPGG
jgi:hypothetical protein